MDAAAIAALSAKAGATDPTLAQVPGRCLHIDGDYAAYYFAGNDDTPVIDAHRNFDSFVASKMRLAGADHYAIHLTAGWSHKGKRYKAATVKPYQGQRDAGRKPKNWDAMRVYLERDEHAKLWEDREADDGCARASFKDGHHLTALLTRDKDFRMIPGLHVGWKDETLVSLRPGESKVENDLPYGPYWFWLQMLMGDTADHIPGCPTVPLGKDGKMVQCGEARAYTWLAGAMSEPVRLAWKVINAYQLAYPEPVNEETWADRFVEQASLLWMRTDANAHVADFWSALDVDALGEVYSPLVDATQRLEDRCA